MLLTNGSLLNGSSSRLIGLYYLNNNYKAANFESRTANESNVTSVSDKSGLPNGYSDSKAWVQPRKAGGLSMPTGEITVDTTFTGNPAAGINLDLDMDVAFSMALSGALVTGASLIMDVAVDLSADVIGKLDATLSLAMSADMTASLSALAGAVLALNTSVNLDADVTALANLTLDITPFTELSAENLAKAVWNYTAALANNPGTTGEKLNSAGGAADPWDDARALTVGKFLALK